VKLTVVGCAGSFPGPDSAASCYLVEAAGFRVLLDLGNGALGSLQRFTDIYGVDAVLVSHLHADHFFDLCSFYVALRYRDPDRRPHPVKVHGPSGTLARLGAAYGTPESEFESVFDVQQHEPTYDVGPFRVSTARMRHPVEAYAMRLEHAGAVLTFSGDTGPTDDLVMLAKGTDVLLSEASFVHGQDNPPDLHLTGREAGEHAARAGAGRLVVTHVPPWHDAERACVEAMAAFDGDVLRAETGLVLTVGGGT
jgi:ribonuclease BN (tRNA processing enzyme)